jgi:hypothetical protein
MLRTVDGQLFQDTGTSNILKLIYVTGEFSHVCVLYFLLYNISLSCELSVHLSQCHCSKTINLVCVTKIPAVLVRYAAHSGNSLLLFWDDILVSSSFLTLEEES